ncbi:MAG: hypothetical protein HY978_02880 [Candidatus Liptonbacteria bacterium]|nr:hypothetical protein [Candidatus Liptonbacteria bacterium]
MTLLLKNFQVLDGQASEALRADVFVSGDRISAVGNFPDKRADQVIDGQGAYLAPGFIDAHNESDRSFGLLEDLGQDAFRGQGLTTIIGGYEGISLAPFSPRTTALARSRSNHRRLNADWQTVRELLWSISRRRAGVNFATLVGYQTSQKFLAGLAEIQPASRQSAILEKAISQALEGGALGLSFAGEEFEFLSGPERERWAKLVAHYHRVLAVGATRDNSKCHRTVKSLGTLAARTGTTIILNGFLSRAASSEEWQKLIQAAESAPLYFVADLADWRVVELSDFLPPHILHQTIADTLIDPWWQKRILAELPETLNLETVIASAPESPELVGRTLGSLLADCDLADHREALLWLMRRTQLLASVAVPMSRMDGFAELTAHDQVLFATGWHQPDFRERIRQNGEISNPAGLTYLEWITQVNKLPIAAAIRRITSLPATVFQLKERGTISVGRYADLVGFSGGEIQLVVVGGQVAPLLGGRGVGA